MQSSLGCHFYLKLLEFHQCPKRTARPYRRARQDRHGGCHSGCAGQPPGMRGHTNLSESQRPRQAGLTQLRICPHPFAARHCGATRAASLRPHRLGGTRPCAATPSAWCVFNGAQFSSTPPPPARTSSRRCVPLRRLQATCGAMPPADTRPCVCTKKNRPPKGAACLVTDRRRCRPRFSVIGA